MVTLNDLLRDFPEAYMKYDSDAMLRYLNPPREQFILIKRDAITEPAWDKNQNKGMGGFDQSKSNWVPRKV